MNKKHREANLQVKNVLKKACEELKKSKIPHPEMEAEILLAHIIQKNREFLLTHPQEELKQKQFEDYQKLIKKRIDNMPIAYLTGQKKFYGLNFFVNEATLVPRPETEFIIDEILALSDDYLNSSIFIDIGTGSGCIIVTLTKKLKSKINNEFFGIDISTNALKIAIKNAKANKVDKQIKFVKSNLGEAIFDLKLKTKKIIITANLPYLTPDQIKNSPSIKHEPKLALIGGNDGLKYYKELFSQLKKAKKELNIPFLLYCEIDDSQVEKIKELIKTELTTKSVKIKKDLAGLNRLVIVDF